MPKSRTKKTTLVAICSGRPRMVLSLSLRLALR